METLSGNDDRGEKRVLPLKGDQLLGILNERKSAQILNFSEGVLAGMKVYVCKEDNGEITFSFFNQLQTANFIFIGRRSEHGWTLSFMSGKDRHSEEPIGGAEERIKTAVLESGMFDHFE